MDQQRLFRLAVEAGMVQFSHVPGAGWTLTLRVRRGQELWDETPIEIYERLTTVELLDTIYASLDSAL